MNKGGGCFVGSVALLFILQGNLAGFHVSAFPDHLLGPMGCETELATDEVIMNSMVLGYEDSKDPDIVVVLEKGVSSHATSPLAITHVPIELNFMLLNPNNVGNVQYVMDTSEGAVFVNGQCKRQQRVLGTKVGHDIHTLRITEMPTKDIMVWAGWATGHSPVSLTNKFILQPTEQKVQQIVQQVQELQHAEAHERMENELLDDDATVVGDVEVQLEKMMEKTDGDATAAAADSHIAADPDAAAFDNKSVIEKMMKAEVARNRDKRHNHQHHGGALPKSAEQLKGMLEEKGLLTEKLGKLDWSKIKNALAAEAANNNGGDDNGDLKEKRKAMFLGHHNAGSTGGSILAAGAGLASANLMETLKGRQALWKDRLIKEKLKKGEEPKDAEEEEMGDEHAHEHRLPPIPMGRERAHVLYEAQHESSEITFKQMLIGLLGILSCNWFVLQLCLWNEKKKKGRRAN